MKNYLKTLVLGFCMVFTNVQISYAETSRPCSKEVSIYQLDTFHYESVAEPVIIVAIDTVAVSVTDSFCELNRADLAYRFTMITSHKVPSVVLSDTLIKPLKVPVNYLKKNYNHYSFYSGHRSYQLRC